MRTGYLLSAALLTAALAASGRADPCIYPSTSNLLPNTPNHFNDTTGSYDIQQGSGGRMRLDSGTQPALFASQAGKNFISTPLALAADTTVSVAAGSTLTLYGGIDGSSSTLALTGAGKLILTGSNSHGATNIAAGSTLQVGNGALGGSLDTAVITDSGQINLASMALPLANPLSGNKTVIISEYTEYTRTSTADTFIIMPTGTLQVGNGGTSGLLIGGTVNNSGNLTFDRTDAATHTSAISGAGTVTQAGAGNINLAAYQGTGPINVQQSGAQLTLGSTSAPRQTPAAWVNTSTLTMADGSILDTTNHGVIIGNTTAATVQDMLLAPFGLGNNQNGPQITSSTEGVDDAFIIPIDASLLGGVGNSLNGGTVTDPNSVLLLYSFNGDVTMDGQITSDDINSVLSAYAAHTTTAGVADLSGSWEAGDVTLDGSVTVDDINTVLSAYAHHKGQLLGTLSSPDSGGLTGGISAVPEPGSLLLLELGGVMALGRLHSRKRCL